MAAKNLIARGIGFSPGRPSFITTQGYDVEVPTSDQADLQTARVLSGQPLPLLPPHVGPDLEHYFRSLHDYLRRLAVKYTESYASVEVEAALPDIADRTKDYVLVYDSGTQEIKWIETVSSCPT